MKIQELRIGNLVFDNLGGILKIKGISTDSDLSHLRPIPLTEEWLLKFGATRYTFDNGKPLQYRLGDRLFVIRKEKYVDYGTSVILEYVHQFQNFIFAIANKELTIK